MLKWNPKGRCFMGVFGGILIGLKIWIYMMTTSNGDVRMTL